MAGKTNTKQIGVFKTKKVLIEFMDDTRYDSKPMAWPHTSMSRIRINAKDYSKGIGDLATDAFYNLSIEEFYRIQNSILKAKPLTINDYSRSNKHLEDLQKLKKFQEQNSYNGAAVKEIEELALQFKNSPNELFSEAGNQILVSLSKMLMDRENINPIDKMLEETNAEVDEIKKGRIIFSDIKILNYDKYVNPENEQERRVTMLKIVYNPKMNYPYSFTVANGWGVPITTQQKGVMIKEGSVRYTDTVYIPMDEKNLFPILKRIDIFIQAITSHGIAEYFETVRNPILYHEMDDTD